MTTATSAASSSRSWCGCRWWIRGPAPPAASRKCTSVQRLTSRSSIVQPEANLDLHLVLSDPALLDASAHLGDLEPVEIPQVFRGPLDPFRDRLRERILRRTNDF